MTNRIHSTIGMAIALCLVGSSSSANAAGFTPEYKQHWLESARALIAATTAEAEVMDVSCHGVSLLGMDTVMRTEYFQVPRWAFNAHLQTCLAFHTIAKGGHGFGRLNAGDACKNMKNAVAELGKARPGADPDDVVAVAGELRTALVSLAAEFRDARACKFG